MVYEIIPIKLVTYFIPYIAQPTRVVFVAQLEFIFAYFFTGHGGHLEAVVICMPARDPSES